MNELRQIGRAASALALLALLAGALAFHAMHVEQHNAMHTAVTLAAGMPVVTSAEGDRTGLQVGDVVESIDGYPPRSLAQVEQAVASGHPAAFRVRRDGRDVDVTLH